MTSGLKTPPSAIQSIMTCAGFTKKVLFCIRVLRFLALSTLALRTVFLPEISSCPRICPLVMALHVR